MKKYEFLKTVVLVFGFLVLGCAEVWGAAGDLVWSYDVGGDIKSDPALGADGTIYIHNTDGYLYAIASDGSFQWKVDVSFDQDLSYIDAQSPAVGSDGTVYIGSNNGYLYAIFPNGTVNWRFKANNAINSTPAINFDGTIYFGSLSGSLYAINLDGSLQWEYRTESNSIHNSPSIGPDGTIYFGSQDNYFYAINPDGSLKWKYKTDNEHGLVASAPSFASDGTIYFGGHGPYFYSLYTDGTLKWKYDTGGGKEATIFSSPVIDGDGTIYFITAFNGEWIDEYLNLFAMNPDGTIKWKNNMGGSWGFSPSIGADGTIYSYDSSSHSLYAISKNGSVL